MDSAIKVNNLSVAYSGIDAINDITFTIKKGEFVSVIGPNGSGKTTLINTILGFLKQNSGEIEITKGSFLSYVPQISEIDRNFPITVLETVMTAFLKSGLHPFKRFSKEEKEKALDLLKTLGLENYEKRQIAELSGGEFQRLLIARALAANPDIVLLDEPTASVDKTSRDKIFSTLKALNEKGITVIIVTHDLAAAFEFSSKLIVINRELIYCGKPEINKDINRVMYGGTFIEKSEVTADD